MIAFMSSRTLNNGLLAVGVFEDDSTLLRLDAGRGAMDAATCRVSLVSGDDLEQDILEETRAWDL